MPKSSRQIAALPYRMNDQRELEILLVTTRETGRWTLPKGWPMKGIKDHQAAAIEAFEEAGVRGKPSRTPIGEYDYVKSLPKKLLPCHVVVFPLKVASQEVDWKEAGQRVRLWASPGLAADMVQEPPLKALLARVEQLVASRR